MLRTFKNLDEDKRAGLSRILGALFKDNVKAAVNTILKQKEKKPQKPARGGKRKYAVVKRRLRSK